MVPGAIPRDSPVAHRREGRTTMRIGILGAGKMAEALGTQWSRAGHDLLVGARTPAKAEALAGRIGPRVRSGDLAPAAAYGDATLLVVLHEGLPAVLGTVGGARGGGARV